MQDQNDKHSVLVESLENRLLLHHGIGGLAFGFGGGGRDASTLEFSQAPSAVQTGLDTLATTDSLNAPTTTQTVYLGNRNGVETYTVNITGTGTQSALTVDENGTPVTAPTNSTTTYGAVPSAVSAEASAIATALGLTVPVSTANVQVSTPAGGVAVYTFTLTNSSSTSHHMRGRSVSIDANGNPVGNQNLPFSAMPTTIQNAFNNNLPTGATALATTSTQNVSVRTENGVTTYSTRFTATGTTTIVTVNAAGVLASLPSRSTTTYSTLDSTIQAGLSTLAADKGFTGTIAGTQTVQVYNEGNGTTIYSVTVGASKTGSSGKTYTYNLTVSVDGNGNPTVAPTGGGSPFRSGRGGFGRHGRR